MERVIAQGRKKAVTRVASLYNKIPQKVVSHLSLSTTEVYIADNNTGKEILIFSILLVAGVTKTSQKH